MRLLAKAKARPPPPPLGVARIAGRYERLERGISDSARAALCYKLNVKVYVLQNFITFHEEYHSKYIHPYLEFNVYYTHDLILCLLNKTKFSSE